MNNALPISISALGVESAHTLLVSYSLRVQVLDAWSLRPVEGAEVAMLVIDGRHLPCFDLVTDSHGIVQIPIPLGAARAPTFSLKVRFERFAAVAEPSRKEFELGRRMDGRLLAHRAVVGEGSARVAVDRGVLWDISWSGGEGSEARQPGDPAWRWHLRPLDVAMGELARCPEFETELTWQDLPGAASAPGCAPGDWGSIQEAAWGYSMFRAEGNDSPELVVYALQATTPLWFGKPVQYVVHDGTVVARSRFPLGAPFMVSRAEGSGSGGVNDGGRDFGKFVPKLNPKPAPPTNCTPAQAAKWNANSHGSEQIRREVLDQGPPELARWRPHEGIDLVGLEGVTPVFSICAGVVLHIDETGGYGHEVIIALRPRVAGRPERMIRYAHLAARSHLSKNQLVIPGTLLGLVGRTSKVPPVVQTDFYGPRSPTHLHIELREASRMGRPDEVRRLFDGSPVAPHIPEWLLPGNDLPRVLPCDCEKGTLNPRSCRRRGGTSTHVEASCWLRRHEPDMCPYPK